MALVKCPECQREISDRASTCPHCGCPSVPTTNISPSVPPTTIQATGKRWKGVMLIGVLLSIGGCLVTIGASPGDSEGPFMGGVLVFLLGLALFVGARVGAWWHHG